MFVDNPKLDELRQGDILRRVYYPEASGTDLCIDATPVEPLEQTLAASPVIETDRRNFKWLSGRIRFLLRGYVIVISQCCDLELKGRLPKAHAIVLAPILDVPPTISGDTDKLRKLELNDIRDFTNYFHLTQHPPLASNCIVNLNRLFSVSNNDFSDLLSRKVLEMTVDARFTLKKKLQYNFSRPAGDDDHL